MEISLQRLGDNPRDHDGSFSGFYPSNAADVNGLRPDIDPSYAEDPSNASPDHTTFPAWKIYPPPPPAHWHWQGRDSQGQVEGEGGEGVDVSHRGPDGEVRAVPVDSSGGSGAHNKSEERGTSGADAFDFAKCEIPGLEESGFEFGLNAEGVYQVYEKDDGEPFLDCGTVRFDAHCFFPLRDHRQPFLTHRPFAYPHLCLPQHFAQRVLHRS